MSHELKKVCGYASVAAAVMLLASCASSRYGTEPVKQPVAKSYEEQTARPAEPAVLKPGLKKSGEAPKQPAFLESKGDVKHVTASWYGPDFHGKPTACGEVYNMHALTCAHKEYPFGTKLRVVNTRNSKEVECIVNDRGPFVPGRDLDLSYAAAKKIDIVGPGTSAVMIEPTGRDMRYVKYIRYGASNGASNGAVTIQVGSFRDESNAKRLKMALELKYRNAYIMQAGVGGATYYRVRLGKFNGRGDAAKIGGELAEEGYNVLITKYEQQL